MSRHSLLVTLPVVLLPFLGAPGFAAPAAGAKGVSSLIKSALDQKSAAPKGAVADLIAHARAEKDPSLQKIAVTALLKQKLAISKAQKKEIIGLVRDPHRGLLPRDVPVPKTGTIEVRHYSMNGFLDGDVGALKQGGFTITQTAAGTEATLGRIHVIMRETGDDVLRDLADPKVHAIVYDGHSQIGGTVEQALAQPGLQAPTSRKLVALFQCVGTQTLPMLKSKAPLVDVITSNDPLFVAETPKLVGALYAGLHAGENYQQINRRFAQAAWKPGRIVSPNQTATLQNVDFDQDGELDYLQAPGQISALEPQDSLRAERLMSGVHFLRTLNPYYVDDTPGAVYSKEQARTPVISVGLVEGDGKRVTQISARTIDGQRRYEIGLDTKFQGATPAFIGAATVYELQVRLQKDLLGKEDPRAQARALAFAGEYLTVVPRDRAASQAVLDQLTTMNGLPKVSFWALSASLNGNHIVGEDQVDKVAALLGQK